MINVHVNWSKHNYFDYISFFFWLSRENWFFFSSHISSKNVRNIQESSYHAILKTIKNDKSWKSYRSHTLLFTKSPTQILGRKKMFKTLKRDIIYPISLPFTLILNTSQVMILNVNWKWHFTELLYFSSIYLSQFHTNNFHSIQNASNWIYIVAVKLNLKSSINKKCAKILHIIKFLTLCAQLHLA